MRGSGLPGTRHYGQEEDSCSVAKTRRFGPRAQRPRFVQQAASSERESSFGDPLQRLRLRTHSMWKLPSLDNLYPQILHQKYNTKHVQILQAVLDIKRLWGFDARNMVVLSTVRRIHMINLCADCTSAFTS
jgi:hypothetical protein